MKLSAALIAALLLSWAPAALAGMAPIQKVTTLDCYTGSVGTLNRIPADPADQTSADQYAAIMADDGGVYVVDATPSTLNFDAAVVYDFKYESARSTYNGVTSYTVTTYRGLISFDAGYGRWLFTWDSTTQPTWVEYIVP